MLGHPQSHLVQFLVDLLETTPAIVEAMPLIRKTTFPVWKDTKKGENLLVLTPDSGLLFSSETFMHLTRY